MLQQIISKPVTVPRINAKLYNGKLIFVVPLALRIFVTLVGVFEGRTEGDQVEGVSDGETVGVTDEGATEGFAVLGTSLGNAEGAL